VLLQNEIPIAHTVHTSQIARSLGITTVFNPSPLPTLTEVTELVDWSAIDWLIVNEEEARILRDRANSRNRCNTQLECDKNPHLTPELAVLQDLISLSMATFSIVITLGSRGSLLAFRFSSELWLGFHTPPSPGKRPVINTTGAGDCFTVKNKICICYRLMISSIISCFYDTILSDQGFLVAELIRLGTEIPVDQLLPRLKESLQLASQAARLCVENHGTIDSYPSLREVQIHRLPGNS
jgi:ribokinase